MHEHVPSMSQTQLVRRFSTRFTGLLVHLLMVTLSLYCTREGIIPANVRNGVAAIHDGKVLDIPELFACVRLCACARGVARVRRRCLAHEGRPPYK